MATLLMRRVKAQTEILVPLLNHLRAELGEQRANDLVYPTLRRLTRQWVESFASTESDDPIENFRKTSETLLTSFEGDVEMNVLKADDQHLDVDVVGCRYADFFRQLNEPELGAILTCELDDHVATRAHPLVELTRAETLMRGGSHCPFRYRFTPAIGND